MTVFHVDRSLEEVVDTRNVCSVTVLPDSTNNPSSITVRIMMMRHGTTVATVAIVAV
jgi:hypothetical protein